jgi:adenine-specific DNA-methyltransferase
LLSDSGSIFVQIGIENVHIVRLIMDEIFGVGNFVAQIAFRTAWTRQAKFIDQVYDVLLWYTKNKQKMKFCALYSEQSRRLLRRYDWVETKKGPVELDSEQLDGFKPIPEGERYYLRDLTSQGESETGRFPFKFEGKNYFPRKGRSWASHEEGLARLAEKGRIQAKGDNVFYKQYQSDYPVSEVNNMWEDTAKAGFLKQEKNIFVVQTPTKVIERCILMTSDPGELIFDPTCGSGTTAFVAEQWGRRWITCDTSRVAMAIAKQRLMTSTFDYYQLAHPNEGVSSGFNYETVQHITLSSIANNENAPKEILCDRPKIDSTKKRVAGPFTVEAVPSQRVFSFEEDESLQQEPDTSIARSGESAQATDWIDELRIAGIRGRGGQTMEFSRLEHLAATRYLHADGETKDIEPKRVVVSFGSMYSPLGKEQVELAIEEAQRLVPKPKIVVFAAFQFDPEAARNIDETNWPGVTLIKAQMNTDLLTHDLRKKHPTNESFWLVGQPDVELEKKGKEYIVQVKGFDYYNTTTGEIESGDIKKVAMWMLDTNYDGRSLYPRQIFFPMAGEKDGWSKLAKNLKAELDEDVLNELFKGDKSLPFELGDKKRVAVKIIDDRGIESIRIIEVRE